MDQQVICHCCGKPVAASAAELNFRLPDAVASLRGNYAAGRVRANEEFCVLDEKHFFVRAVLPLPVIGREQPYSMGAWVELDEENYRKLVENYHSEDQASLPPLKAKLANDVPFSEGAYACEVKLQLTGVETRPRIEVADSACSLFDDQKNGVHAHRLSQYALLFTAMPASPSTH